MREDLISGVGFFGIGDPPAEFMVSGTSIEVPQVQPFMTVIRRLNGEPITGPSHGTTVQEAVAEAQQGIDFGNSQGMSGLNNVCVDIVQNSQVMATVWNYKTLGVIGASIGGIAGLIALIWYCWK